MSNRTQRVLFVVWGWLALPFLLGWIALAFWFSIWVGVAVVLVTALWLYDMGETTCSRCGSYGTGRCGVQSWFVPLLWRRRSVGSVSRLRVRLHFYFDLLMMAGGVAVYTTMPLLLPFFLAWLALGWWVVYLPGKFHALLPLLAQPQQESRRVGLPMLTENTTDAGVMPGSGVGCPSLTQKQRAWPTFRNRAEGFGQVCNLIMGRSGDKPIMRDRERIYEWRNTASSPPGGSGHHASGSGWR